MCTTQASRCAPNSITHLLQFVFSVFAANCSSKLYHQLELLTAFLSWNMCVPQVLAKSWYDLVVNTNPLGVAKSCGLDIL